MAFLSEEHFCDFFSLLLMWAACHGALQGFAFISPGSITESDTHLQCVPPPPPPSKDRKLKFLLCVKKTKHLVFLFDPRPSASPSIINVSLAITTLTRAPQLFPTSASLSSIQHCHVLLCDPFSCLMDLKVILKTDAFKWIAALQGSSSWCCEQPVLFTVACSQCTHKSNRWITDCFIWSTGPLSRDVEPLLHSLDPLIWSLYAVLELIWLTDEYEPDDWWKWQTQMRESAAFFAMCSTRVNWLFLKVR